MDPYARTLHIYLYTEVNAESINVHRMPDIIAVDLLPCVNTLLASINVQLTAVIALVCNCLADIVETLAVVHIFFAKVPVVLEVVRFIDYVFAVVLGRNVVSANIRVFS